jgi:HlyD family secretion protein
VKKRTRTILILVAVLAVAGVAYWQLKPKAATKAAVSTATVTLGSLQATVNSAGNITSHQTADLTFGQTGTVKKINVKVGDKVKAGDVLGELDSADLQLQYRSAQVSLKNAQDSLAETKSPSTQQAIASARAKVDSAQAAYDKAAAGASKSDIASAQAQLASAQAAYDAALKTAAAANSSLAAATATFEKARIALQTAQGAYDRVSWRGGVGASSEAAALQSATLDYDSAKAAYDAASSTADSDSKAKIASAASTLTSAQTNLTSVKNSVTAADLAAAQSTLITAKNDLDTLLAGPTANALDIAQNGVETAQIAVDQAKLKLQQAQVVAPFDGVVTAIAAKIGQAASGTAFSLADLTNLDIVVNMAEVDVNRVKVGQPADITLDAVADSTFTGLVTQIAPAGVQTSGVVNYPVTIALTKTTEAVKTGMTANLNIVVSQRTNVLIVPNRAVRTVGKQKIATVLFEGTQIQAPVVTGLSSDTATEIVSGLKEGDVVVLNTTTTSAARGIGIGGIGGGPGGPGG